MDDVLRIAIVDRTPLRTAILCEALREVERVEIIVIDDGDSLEARVVEVDPDVVLIDLENPSRDVLEEAIRASGAARRSVAIFVDQSDASMINAAVDAGVSAYVVDGLRKERVKSIVDLAISRFNAFARIREELEAARAQLADRKAIDHAKGLVMRARNLTEEQAYAMMRRKAMNEGKKIVDVARAIILAAEFLQ